MSVYSYCCWMKCTETLFLGKEARQQDKPKAHDFTRQMSVFTVTPGELVELMKYLQLFLSFPIFQFHFIIWSAGERSLLHCYLETGKFCMYFFIFTHHCVYFCLWYLKSCQVVCSAASSASVRATSQCPEILAALGMVFNKQGNICPGLDKSQWKSELNKIVNLQAKHSDL